MTLPKMWTKVTEAFKFSKNEKSQCGSNHSENEIIYSKNNVCVHSHDSNNSTIHNSGYLTISCEKIESENLSNSGEDVILRLSWVSNTHMYRKISEIRDITPQCDVFEEAANRKISVKSYDSGYQDDTESSLEMEEKDVSSSRPQERRFCMDENPTNIKIYGNDVQSPTYIRSELVNGSDSDKTSRRQTSKDDQKNDYLPKLTQIEGFSSKRLTIRPHQNESNFNCKFTVDLGYVKSIRLFFNEDNDSGQLVITSSENQYKILHFHRGGLEKLSEILERLEVLVLTRAQHQNGDDGQLYKHFKICCSRIQQTEILPEETTLSQVTQDEWLDMLNDDGQIEDATFLRKKIFFAGLHKDIRKFVWPFLLNCYPFHSTYEQRKHIKQLQRRQYEKISEGREKFSKNSASDHPFKLIEYLIHKDVIRTDRSHPFYAGDDNPNLNLMKRVLLNYVFYDTEHIYMQGMSDLLAPVLIEIPDEAIAFWCFVDIMKKGLFVCTPTDSDMEKNLTFLRELIRLMQPRFFEHITSVTDGTDLLFCHRWLLLCFKREFAEDTVLQIWEACWSNYLTDYFHLFICLAIIAIYADNIIEQHSNSDDMLYYFSSLAMSINGDLVLKKARTLIHVFRTLEGIPQCLAPLCQRRGSDMWDSKHVPTVDL